MYGAAIPDILAQTDEVPMPQFRTSVGYTSADTMYAIVKDIAAVPFPNSANVVVSVSWARDEENMLYSNKYVVFAKIKSYETKI